MKGHLFQILKPLYFLVTTADRLFFRFFSFLVFNPKAKVVSIGNLTMGGTGKTPVLFELVSELLPEKTCVISRGYRSPWENSFYRLEGHGPHPTELTDEALLFNLRFPDIPLLLGKRRYKSARYAETHIKPDILLLDDGFQYRRLRKDFDILLWDCLMEPEEADLIPAGTLREPISRLKEADVILLTRCEIATSEKKEFWKSWLKAKAPRLKIIEMKTVCEGLFDSQGNKVEQQKIPRNCLAFCAIGRPASFVDQLKLMGLTVQQTVEFRDHHKFSDHELKMLEQKSKESDLSLVCTEKDRVKITQAMAEKLNLLTLRIRVIPASGKTLHSELALAGIDLHPH